MTEWIDADLVFLILTNLMLAGSSRLTACIRLLALQGIALGFLALLSAEHPLAARPLAIALGGMVVKGAVFPWLLTRALREADVRHEVTPYVGFSSSIVAGVGILALSLWAGSRFPVPAPGASALLPPASIFAILMGLFLIAARKVALNQVVGYLVLENGIYVFGVGLVGEIPVLVELGVLLDAFVAVFVMGIAVHHISREFDHIDAGRLDSLKG